MHQRRIRSSRSVSTDLLIHSLAVALELSGSVADTLVHFHWSSAFSNFKCSLCVSQLSDRVSLTLRGSVAATEVI